MRTKKILTMAVSTLAAGGLLAGCASGGSAAPTDSEEPQDLSMTVWTADEGILAAYQELADEYREQNPELGELNVQTVPFDQYLKQLTVQISGGDAPDLGWFVEANTPALIESGVLENIAALEEDSDVAIDDYLPNLLETVRTDEALYGVPFSNGAQPLIYNTGVFERAGVETPLELYERGEWTWENLRRISQEVVAAGEVKYGFDVPQFAFSNYQFLTIFLKGWGAEAFPGGDTCGLNSPEAVEAVEFVRELIFTDATYPGPGETSSFASGDTAMYIGAASSVNQITDESIQIELVPQPTGVNGEDYFLGQAFFGVFAQGENKDLAADFAGFLASNAGAERMSQWFVSGRESLLTPDLLAQANPKISAESAQLALIDPLPLAQQVDYPAAYPEIVSAIKPILDGLWTPEADVAAVLDEACSAAEPLLNQ